MSVHGSLRPLGRDLVFEQQGEGLHVVMVTSLEKILICNDIGRLVLEICDGSHTVGEIVDTLSASFPQVSREQIEEDVDRFLTMAVETGVVT